MSRCLPAFLVLALSASPLFAQGGYGHLEGQIVFAGNAPNLPPLVAMGAQVKDAAICAANPVPDNSLLVDPKTNGVANVFVYLRSAPENVHPKLAPVPAKPAVFDQKGCSFEPHALFVRSGQEVAVYSQDACAHNTHTYPIKNDAVNFLLQPKPPKPEIIPARNTKASEILPIQVKCDIHPWMSAYWLILDHPYATISAADGKFRIENLPAGEHSFRVWHERAGYLERSLKVTIEDGKTTTIDVKETTFPAKEFD